MAALIRRYLEIGCLGSMPTPAGLAATLIDCSTRNCARRTVELVTADRDRLAAVGDQLLRGGMYCLFIGVGQHHRRARLGESLCGREPNPGASPCYKRDLILEGRPFSRNV